MPQHHKIKLANIVELLICLLKTIKNSYFIFVVAEDRADDYCAPHLIPDSGLKASWMKLSTYNSG